MLRLLIETCVHRRVAAMFATLVVAAFGLRAYLDTPIEAYPDVTNTQVTVITQLPGNAPEEIERRVTVPLERELNGTPGMTLMRSESLFGLSLITLTFADDTEQLSRRGPSCCSGSPRPTLPEGVTPELAPEATPLGEVYQFRLVERPPRSLPAARRDAVERGARAAAGARRRRHRARSAAISRRSTSRPTRRACSRSA